MIARNWEETFEDIFELWVLVIFEKFKRKLLSFFLVFETIIINYYIK